MSLIATNNGGGSKYPLLEAGSYPALCYSIVDLGDHYSQLYDKTSHKVLFIWELFTETLDTEEGEKPRVISATYTMSLNEKASMRKMLESWRGRAFTDEELKGFDLAKVLGKPCIISVVHSERNGSTYANVGGVSKAMKGMAFPDKPFNPLVLFDLDAPDFLDALHDLPDWIQQRIKESETWKQKAAQRREEIGMSDDFDDYPEEETNDLPF